MSIEINPDKTLIQREGYYVLDMFSDIGGLYGLLYAFLAIVLTYTNYNHLENFAVSKLYKIERRSKVDKKRPRSRQDQ